MLQIIMLRLQNWVDRILLCAQTLLHDKCGTCQIPADLIREIARCLLPDVVAYCESEEGKAVFSQWKAEQDAKKKEQSKVI